MCRLKVRGMGLPRITAQGDSARARNGLIVKNMITGASQTDGAVLLVDASKGPQEQTRVEEHLRVHVPVSQRQIAYWEKNPVAAWTSPKNDRRTWFRVSHDSGLACLVGSARQDSRRSGADRR